MANDTDVDGQTLTAELVADVTNGLLELAADGSFTYLPDPDFSGTDEFRYKVYDGELYSEAVAVEITVTAVNDQPRPVDDFYVTEFETELVVAAPGVLENDFEADLTDLVLVDVDREPAHGVLILNADGSFSYKPDLEFVGFDSFTYLMLGIPQPASEFFAEATVTIQVGKALYLPLILK